MRLAIAALALTLAAGTASAECVIAEHYDNGGRSGTIQNNDLVKFFPEDQMGLTGEAQYSREFNDAGWANMVSYAEPHGACMVTLYGPWGHIQVRERTNLGADYNDKATGAGCACQ